MPQARGRRQFLTTALAGILASATFPTTALAKKNKAGFVPVTPQDFGARGNGLNDDSPAIQAWLEHLIANSLTGFIPSGDYILKSVVRTRLAKVARFGLSGAGSQVSRFLVHPSNKEGGFDINAFDSRRHQLSLSGFSVIALGNSGIGFRFIMPEGGDQHQRALVMDDVWCRGANRTDNHFLTAFDFTGCWRPRIQNSGWDGPFINVGYANDSPRHYCETGFKLDGCYGLSIEDCFAWGCQTGISARVFDGRIAEIRKGRQNRARIILENGPMPFSPGTKVRLRGTKSYDGTYTIHKISSSIFEIDSPFIGSETGFCALEEGPEGMNFKDNTINGVLNGIWVERPNGREPTCWINGNHINYRDFGIVLDGVKLVQMDQNNTYNQDIADTFGGAPKDIDLRNVSEYIIGSHVFQFIGHSRRVGIRVASETFGEGDNGLIHHCIFSGKFDIGIHLTRNASGIRVGPNIYPGQLRIRVKDDNGRNLVQ